MGDLGVLVGGLGACFGDLEAYLGHALEEDTMKAVIQKNIGKHNENQRFLDMVEGLELHVVSLYGCSGASVARLVAWKLQL